MKIDNLASLKLYELTEKQYKQKCANDDIDDNALYLTHNEDIDSNVLVYHPIGVGNLSGSEWWSICFGNGKFVTASCTGNEGIMYSYDGISWNKAEYISENLDYYCWYSVCYGNGVFVAVSYDGCFAYSADGITWEETTHKSEGYIDVCYGNGKFVAVADDASYAIAHSYDGITWEETRDYGHILSSVCYGNGKFVAAAEAVGTLTSTDGITWEQHAMPVLSYPDVKIAYGNGVFVIADQERSGEGPLFYSYDGINWTLANNCGYGAGQVNPDNRWDIVYCGDRFIAYEYGITNFAISYDGVNWELLDGLDHDSNGVSGVYDICYGNDTYVAICDTVTLLSYDGRTFGKNGSVTCNGKDVTKDIVGLLGGGSSSETVFVTVDYNSMEASHKATEIHELVKSGKTVVMCIDARYYLLQSSDDSSATFAGTSDDGFQYVYYIWDDGSVDLYDYCITALSEGEVDTIKDMIDEAINGAIGDEY